LQSMPSTYARSGPKCNGPPRSNGKGCRPPPRSRAPVR
jgi:hypothetical protein